MKNNIAKRINLLIPSGIRKVNFKATEMEKRGIDVIHLEMGRPDFDTPEYIKKAAIKSIENGRVFYTSNFGTDELRQAIADKLLRENNVGYSADEILVTVGLSEAIYCILNTILEAGDEILVPDPVWMNYINIPRLLGAVPVTYELLEENNYQPNIKQMEKMITPKTKAIVLNSPNNPTGSVLSEETIHQIASIALKYDLIILSDEVYERIIFDGEEHVSIAAVNGMKDRTILLNGFSKAYSMTGWRLGYMAGPAEIIKAVNKTHQIVTTCAAMFVQDAGVAALSKEQNEVQLMVEEYDNRRKYITQAINNIKGLSCIEPKGAFYVFINIKGTGMTSDEAAEFFLEVAHVAMVPGTVFGNNGEGYIRLSYACSMEQLKEAAKRIEEALERRQQNEV